MEPGHNPHLGTISVAENIPNLKPSTRPGRNPCRNERKKLIDAAEADRQEAHKKLAELHAHQLLVGLGLRLGLMLRGMVYTRKSLSNQRS